jgi:hypothetical protein
MERMREVKGLLLVLLAVGMVGGWVAHSGAAESERTEELLQIPRDRTRVNGSGAGRLDNPRGIGVDPATDHIFIADLRNSRVSEFTSWGAFVKVWGWGVADGEAEAEVCGPVEPEIAPPASLCRPGIAGNGPGQLSSPRGVAVDEEGNVYVVDGPVEGTKGQRVEKFGPDGEFLLMFGGEVNETTHLNRCTKADLDGGDVCGRGVLGTGDGQFATAGLGNFIAIGPDGTIYVGDVGRIQEFERDGAYKGSIELNGALAGKTVEQLAVGPDGSLYIVVRGAEISTLGPYRVDSAGEPVGPSLSVEEPGALAVDVEGNLYVVEDPPKYGLDETEPRVLVFAPDGTVLVPSEAEFSRLRVRKELAPGRLQGLATSVLGDEGEDADEPGDLYVSTHFGTTPVESYVTAYGPFPRFEPAPPAPAAITAQYATTVDTTTSTLQAEISPHFFAGTTYYLEYGTGKCSEGGCTSSTPAPLRADGDLPTATDPISLTDLMPGTTYHYRFVAISGPFTTRGLGDAEDGLEATFVTPLGSGPPPDGRAFELVSPALKNNAELPGGPPGFSVAPIQAAPSGSAVTYTSTTAFGADPESAPASSQYVSRRGAGGWLTQNITPRDEESYLTDPVRGFSEDLAKAAVVVLEPPLTADAPQGFENLYAMDTASEAVRLVTPSTPPEIDIARLGYCVDFAGAAEDFSRIYFAANGKLTAEAVRPGNAGEVNLYEWSEAGGVRLVNKLPNNTVVQPASVGGFGSNAPCTGTPKNILFRAVSNDGRKAFWATKTALYARVNGTSTVQLDRNQDNPGPNGGGTFWAASEDGSTAFFTDRSKLTSVGVAATNGLGDLYRYDFDEPLGSRLEDLTPGSAGKGVLGVVGASEDGSVAYFASEAVLAGNAGPAGGTAEDGAANLYRWKEGEGLSFIATLRASSDGSNWTAESRDQTARVTPDGDALAFVSTASLTGYDNTDQESGDADAEAFLYDAGAEVLVCASCRASGARPSSPAHLPSWTTPFEQRRYLSDDGSRLFFETADALDVEDDNGLTDVYEFELEGKGTCSEGSNTFDPFTGGCTYLLSTGKSLDEYRFLDAGASGEDVFLATRAQLVPRDIDERVDVYDARVGGFEPPLPAEPEPCTDLTACRGTAASPPPPSEPATGGPQKGNLKPAGTKRCPKGTHRVKKKGKFRCVKNRKKRVRK